MVEAARGPRVPGSRPMETSKQTTCPAPRTRLPTAPRLGDTGPLAFVLAIVVVGSAFAAATTAMGSSPAHPISPLSSATSAASAGPRPSSYGPGVVNGTLVLANNTYFRGSFPAPVTGFNLESPVFDAATGDIYVADSGNDNISVINPVLNEQVDNFPTYTSSFAASVPGALAVDPVNGKLYIGTVGTGLEAMNVATGGFTSNFGLCQGTCAALAYDTTDGDLFIANENTNNVTVLDPANGNVLANVAVGTSPEDLAVDGANGDVFVSNFGSDNVSVLSGSTFQVLANDGLDAGLTTLTQPSGSCYDATDNAVFVADQGSANMTAISATTFHVLYNVSISTVGYPYPVAVACSAATGAIYVAGESPSTLPAVFTINNPISGLITSSSDYPYVATGILIDPTTNELYVTTAWDALAVFSEATDTVIGTIAVSDEPYALTFDSTNSEIYVGNYTGPGIVGSLVGVSTSTNHVSEVAEMAAFGGTSVDPTGNAYDPASDEVLTLASSVTTNYIAAYDPVANSFVTIATGGVTPIALSYDPGDMDMWVVGQGNGGNWLTPINAANTIGTAYSLGPLVPSGLTYDPTNGDIYVVVQDQATGGNTSVLAIDPSSGAVVATIPTPNTIENIAYDPSNQELYAPALFSELAVINATLGRNVANISLSSVGGATPINTIYDPVNGDLYTTDDAQSSVDVVNAAQGKLVATIPVGLEPIGLALNASGTEIFVASLDTGTIAVISLTAPGNSGPSVTGVTVSPTSTTVGVSQSASFSASATCSGGACPAGVAYAWSLSNGLGTYAPATGTSTTFVAGTSAGSSTLTVTASYDGTSASASAAITISSTPVATLSSVSVSPAPAVVSPSGTQSFLAKLSCTGGNGICPNGWTITWSLGNSALGALNTTIGTTVVKFTATNVLGKTDLNVSVVLNGRTATYVDQVTVSANSGSSTSGGGSPWLIYAILGAVVAAGVIGAVLFLRARKPKAPSPSAPAPAAAAAPPPPPPPPPPPAAPPAYSPPPLPPPPPT
jgi:YVTN family beta-propeller protein